MFVFDSDHLSILQSREQPEYRRILARTELFPPDAFYVSIVSFHEQINGWNTYLARAKSIEGVVWGYEKLMSILRNFASTQVLPFDREASEVFESLRRQKIRVDTMDLRIASIALARDFTVLTRNLVDFQKVPGLKVEDWTAG